MITFRVLFVYLLVMFPFAKGLLAAVTDESAPTVHSSALLPKEVLNGEGYTIDPEVPTYGFMGIFRLHTAYGDYKCVGREMLFVRLSELRALVALEKVSRNKAFLDAAKEAAEEPVKSAVKIARNPVGNVARAPVGVAKLFRDVFGGALDAGKGLTNLAKPHRDDSPKPPPSREDPLGYNQARNEWAVRLGVDPYTTNRELALKLNHLAMISFGTNKVAGAGVGFGMGAMGPIASWLSWLPDIDEHLLTAPPSDVREANSKRLSKLGVAKRDMEPLLNNPWFTPTLEIRFVSDLARLEGVRNLASATQLAGVAGSEEQARFLCGSLELLDQYQKTVGPLRDLRTYQGIPSAISDQGALIVATPVDLLSWTKTTDHFASQRDPNKSAILYVNGPVTQRAQEGLAARGWRVVEQSATRAKSGGNR